MTNQSWMPNYWSLLCSTFGEPNDLHSTSYTGCPHVREKSRKSDVSFSSWKCHGILFLVNEKIFWIKSWNSQWVMEFLYALLLSFYLRGMISNLISAYGEVYHIHIYWISQGRKTEGNFKSSFGITECKVSQVEVHPTL